MLLLLVIWRWLSLSLLLSSLLILLLLLLVLVSVLVLVLVLVVLADRRSNNTKPSRASHCVEGGQPQRGSEGREICMCVYVYIYIYIYIYCIYMYIYQATKGYRSSVCSARLTTVVNRRVSLTCLDRGRERERKREREREIVCLLGFDRNV